VAGLAKHPTERKLIKSLKVSGTWSKMVIKVKELRGEVVVNGAD